MVWTWQKQEILRRGGKNTQKKFTKKIFTTQIITRWCDHSPRAKLSGMRSQVGLTYKASLWTKQVEVIEFQQSYFKSWKMMLWKCCTQYASKFGKLSSGPGEGNGTPLQYSCLENPMDGGAWKAAVNGVAEGWTRLSNFTFTFHFHALEKEMAAHQAPPSLGFSRQEHWNGLPYSPPGEANPETEPRSTALQADSLTSEPPGKPFIWGH